MSARTAMPLLERRPYFPLQALAVSWEARGLLWLSGSLAGFLPYFSCRDQTRYLGPLELGTQDDEPPTQRCL